MKLFYSIIVSWLFAVGSLLAATEFTISSYNCGGLSDHYDYLRAASMQKLMQERYNAEPENMALNDKIQKLALKILFSSDPVDKTLAQQEWDRKDYQSIFERLTLSPMDTNSPNTQWYQKMNSMITTYNVRPVLILDEEVNQKLHEHLTEVCKGKEGTIPELLQEARATMARRIFADHLKYDIICMQEADYIEASFIPSSYQVLFSETSHSINAIAWNKERFELVESLGNILGKAIVIQLLDKESGKTILVASAHLSGCNPFRIERDPKNEKIDSAKGDTELQTIIDIFDSQGADLMMMGMDSNVTSLHPRLNILKDAGYILDGENYLEPTCSNPYQVVDTRIDWIALKSNETKASIVNIPILSIGLNNLQTNISDHVPVAAKIRY